MRHSFLLETVQSTGSQLPRDVLLLLPAGPYSVAEGASAPWFNEGLIGQRALIAVQLLTA